MSVVVCSWGSTVERGTESVRRGALAFGAAAGLPRRGGVAGTDGEAVRGIASRHGVEAVDVIGDAKLGGCGPDVLTEALAQYFAKAPAAVVLFNQSAASRLVAPRLATRLAGAVVTNVLALRHEDGALHVSATAYGGDTHVVYRMPPRTSVVCVATTTLATEPAAASTEPKCNPVDVDLGAIEERFKVVAAPRAEGPRLEDAEIIVGGGRGLGKADNLGLVRDLAAALGGMWGGSRPIVDEGWIDASRQARSRGRDCMSRPAFPARASTWRDVRRPGRSSRSTRTGTQPSSGMRATGSSAIAWK